MKTPVLLVDIDGVIITGRPHDGAAWWTDLSANFGFKKSDLTKNFFSPYWADIVRGKDALLPRLTDALKVMESSVNAKEVRDFWFANDAQLNHNVCHWMNAKRAAGHRIMLASNQDHSRAEYLMSDLGLNQYCDGAYFSAELGTVKPELEFYAAIQQAEKCDPADLMLIDDTKENVAAAEALGWQAHLYHGQPLDQIS